MLALLSADQYNDPWTHAISESIEKLIDELPKDFVEFEDTWVHKDSVEWFSHGYDDDGAQFDQHQYYWIAETQVKYIK